MRPVARLASKDSLGWTTASDKLLHIGQQRHRLCCCLLQVTVDGPSLITMPGTLAKHYKQLGGRLQLMGKPDPLIYAAAQDLMAPQAHTGSGQQQQQWLAIGDSLEHDVCGYVLLPFVMRSRQPGNAAGNSLLWCGGWVLCSFAGPCAFA